MKKILVLYTSIGLGHKYIAENIAYHLEQAGYEVLLHDILTVQKGLLVDVGTWLHSFINRRLPFIWRWLYFSKLVNAIGLPLRIKLAKGNSENLERIVNQFNPDAILSTQTTGSAATAALIEQKKFHGKFIVAFSDFHLHKFWLYPYVDMYLANIVEQKQQMMQLGISENQIAVCGITLKPRQDIDRNKVREKLGVLPEQTLVIFGSGSLGIGFDYNLLGSYLEQLINTRPDIVVAVMCGKNEKLRSSLVAARLHNIIPLGFYSNPVELYHSAELLVTKPGGLTTTEALQAGIKILVTHTLPGQEEPNYDYLLERNLIFSKPQPLTAEKLVEQTIRVLASSQLVNEDARQAIIQSGIEGQAVVAAINSLWKS